MAPLLEDFLADNRDRIIARTRAKVADRLVPLATQAELESGIPLFLTQLGGMLRTPLETGGTAIGEGAVRHADDLLRLGLTVGQVVHDYGGLCQAITEIAVEDDVAISSGDFKTLNACLDHAIATAVAEFGRQRENSASADGVQQLGVLAHELRNSLHAAIMAFDAIREGTVGANGSTSAILARSLTRMSLLVERALAEVRLKTAIQTRTRVVLATLIGDLAALAAVDAQHRGVHLTVQPVDTSLAIDADPCTIFSALENLLQNAFKFTRPQGCVALRTSTSGGRVRMEIEDECGGLPVGKEDEIFRAFRQLGTDRSGVGLGLTISRQGIEANGGTLHVRDLPGKGCVFTVDLPLLA